MKPGYLTTEFWLTVIVGILTNLGTIEVPERYRWIVNLGLVAGYALSRGLAKYESPASPVLGSTLAPEPVDPVGVEQASQGAVAQLAAPKPRKRTKKAA